MTLVSWVPVPAGSATPHHEGLPEPRDDHAAAMAEMALDMQASLSRLCERAAARPVPLRGARRDRDQGQGSAARLPAYLLVGRLLAAEA